MAAYLDDLIAACDALEQRILDAQQACGRALAALDAARKEIATEHACQHGTTCAGER